MRFKFKSRNLYSTLLIISVSYILYLGQQGQLNLYIHPRYILFTVAMSVVGLLVLMADRYYGKEGSGKHTHNESTLSLLPLLFLVGAALVLPARTLSSATVSQRTIDAGSIASSTQSLSTSSLFKGSSRGIGLGDWSKLLSINTDPAYYKNKPAKITGFVYDAELGQDTVWLARFLVTCCAVDAQPVGVPVQIKDWEAVFGQNTWLEIEGEFKLADTEAGQQIVLIPEKVNKVEQPDSPYAN